MPRIPQSELERLKKGVSLLRLLESQGHELKKHGQDYVTRCPFHDDKTPSLVVSPKTNLWHCLGACQMGGSVIDWMMKRQGVSFRRAVALLRMELGEMPTVSLTALVPAVDSSLAAPPLDAADDELLLGQVLDYYHVTLKQSPEALAYLRARGLDHPELIDTFWLGYANRTLGYQLPQMQVKSGAAIRGALQRIGIYRGTGHEHFNGSLVIPIMDAQGQVHEVYGRKVTRDTQLRSGTPKHVYLPGPHKGVFNEAGFTDAEVEEVILCESLIDALTFWCAGYRNVTSSYGIEGFTDEILAAFHRHGMKRVLIAYDADDAGNSAADKLSVKLMAEGFECYRCRFPKGMDANEYALHGRSSAARGQESEAAAQEVTPASKSLGLVIRQAEWLGAAHGCANVARGRMPEAAKGAASLLHPTSQAVSASAPTSLPSLAAALAEDVILENATKEESEVTRIPSSTTTLSCSDKEEPEPLSENDFVPAHRVPPVAVSMPIEISATGELALTLGNRAYAVRGIEKNLSYEKLGVWIKASCGDFVHIDTLELYQAKQRAAWIKQASIELGLSEEVLKADLGKLLRALELRQDEIIKQKLNPSTKNAAAVALNPAQHDAAMSLLKDPSLIERIVADVEATGVVGEASNALVAYLACVSRKLDKPLAILIQSTSAAGKSTLMDAMLALMPESERVHYSAMTGQSLFYLGETSMKHKILAIAEEEGVRQAAYALKLLQSQGELTIASTGKDPTTGQLVTQEYRVEGPVMLFLTTTAIDLDEELLNRCLVLTINESREQTAAIQAQQRTSRTLEGLLAKAQRNEILEAHRAAQTLLRPLAVVNPYAQALTFACDQVRLRRDHQKYLALIDAIALLHQYQRPIHSVRGTGGKVIEYIEVSADDIALANRLAHEVLGRSLDELPPQTRNLLGQIQAWVEVQVKARVIERSLLRFTRRELRAALAISDKQLRVHLDRLLELDYVIAHAGRNGQRFVYELAFDGDVQSTQPHAVGLCGIDQLQEVGTMPNLVGVEAKHVGRSWPDSGQLVGTSSPVKTALNTSADAALSSLAAAFDQTALLGSEKTAASYRNGASYVVNAPRT